MMIKANELRIGDLAYYIETPGEEPTIGTVDIINEYSQTVSFNGTDGFDYRLIDPIPITEEWLERMGFEGGSIRFSYHTHIKVEKYTTLTQGWIDNAWRVVLLEAIPHSLGRHFHFVHELQNLYFSLTGEELNIKLPA